MKLLNNNFFIPNQIYTGKAVGADRAKEVGKRVVLDLAQCLGDGYNICCDNYFTSVGLAYDLLKQNKTIIGTIRKNKKEIPPEFQDLKQREFNSSIYGFNNNLTLLSYVPASKASKYSNNKKLVLLLSTSHHYEDHNSHVDKPQMVVDYNSQKSGVDTVD